MGLLCTAAAWRRTPLPESRRTSPEIFIYKPDARELRELHVKGKAPRRRDAAHVRRQIYCVGKDPAAPPGKLPAGLDGREQTRIRRSCRGQFLLQARQGRAGDADTLRHAGQHHRRCRGKAGLETDEIQPRHTHLQPPAHPRRRGHGRGKQRRRTALHHHRERTGLHLPSRVPQNGLGKGQNSLQAGFSHRGSCPRGTSTTGSWYSANPDTNPGKR